MLFYFYVIFVLYLRHGPVSFNCLLWMGLSIQVVVSDTIIGVAFYSLHSRAVWFMAPTVELLLAMLAVRRKSEALNVDQNKNTWVEFVV